MQCIAERSSSSNIMDSKTYAHDFWTKRSTEQRTISKPSTTSLRLGGETSPKGQHEALRKRRRDCRSKIVIGFIALFFYTHQTEATGFFTSSFGGIEALLLYGAILIGMAGPVARFLTGRRNKSRPPELIASVFWIVASAWFLMVVFPFDFAHFADVVPDFLRVLISWITNDIARVLIAIGMVGGIVFIGVNSVLYIKVGALLEQQSGSSRVGY
jgi:hypothetical protein